MIVKTQILQILEIERFAIHDGPGIRTVVFLSGCPLRCPWCANPESWTPEKKLMHTASKCVGCGSCAKACPKGAVSMAPGGKPVFDRSKCAATGCCVEACPTGALRMSGQAMSVDEVLSVVLRDAAYYRNSGGGLTVSGGEPFQQFEGLMALLSGAREAGLHTAVETTAQTAPERFQKAEPLVDLFLLDFKHPDPAALQSVTKARPDVIFANMAWLSKAAPKKVILRVPVIPGFNHSRPVMEALFQKAREFGFTTVHLLPYHTLGMDKYSQLGMEYPWPHQSMLSGQDLEPWRRLGTDMGLTVL